METKNKGHGQLPNEYWIENPEPQTDNTEFVKLFNKQYNENIGGNLRYYKIINEKSAKYEWDIEKIPDDSDPIIPFEDWKAAILGESEYSILSDYSIDALMDKPIAIVCTTKEEWRRATSLIPRNRILDKWGMEGGQNHAFTIDRYGGSYTSEEWYRKNTSLDNEVYTLIPASKFLEANEKKEKTIEKAVVKEEKWVPKVGEWVHGKESYLPDNAVKILEVEGDTVWYDNKGRTSNRIKYLRPATKEEIPVQQPSVEEIRKQIDQKMGYPEYKVGMRVLVHSGANVGTHHNGKIGIIEEVDKTSSYQPNIGVKFDNGWTWCYPQNNNPFNVEILPDKQQSVQVDVKRGIGQVSERKWKIGDRFQYEGKNTIYTIGDVEGNEVKIVWNDTYIYYKVENVDGNWNRCWIPYNPDPIPVTREPQVGDRVRILKDNGNYKGKVGKEGRLSEISNVSAVWWVTLDDGTFSCYLSGKNGTTKEVEVITNNNNQSTTNNNINQTKNQKNEKSSSKIDNYEGNILCEEINEELITGKYLQGKVLVSSESECLIRGTRSRGTILAC